MIAVKDHAEGCVLPVRAVPGARKTGVLGERGGALKVAVTAPPEDGRANKALVEALAGALGLKRSQVELIGGQTSRDKCFLIRGVARADLEKRVAALSSFVPVANTAPVAARNIQRMRGRGSPVGRGETPAENRGGGE